MLTDRSSDSRQWTVACRKQGAHVRSSLSLQRHRTARNFPSLSPSPCWSASSAIIIERRLQTATIATTEQLGYGRVLAIGAIQCLALIPGVSRSAATIIGSLLLGASRSCAVEFSFFLAIPTMFAASAYTFYKEGAALNAEEWTAAGVGFLTAFIVSWWVIARLMDFIRRRDLEVFGWYRVILGALLIALHLGGRLS